jgi:acetyl-CoA synthase
MLKKALVEKGPDTMVEFPNTAYFLPTIYGMTGLEVTTLGQLPEVLEHARGLLHPIPANQKWTPYLGETLDSGMATLLAAEIIEAIRFVYNLQPEPFPGIELTGGTAYPNLDNGGGPANHLNGPIDDIQLRSWGIQLVDGRMPGFAAIVGCAKSNEVAVKLVRELQRRNILIFLSGNVNGRSIINQLEEEGVELGYDTYTIPFGTDTISAIYALGFATRSALTFGGIAAGQARDILLYNKKRVFAFVIALGEVDDLKYAAAAGAINYGFPVIADTVIPEILPTGVTDYEHVVSMPFEQIEGADDLERAERLVQKCIEIRGVKIKMHDVPVPVPYGSAFEGEVVRKADMRIEFGGRNSRCFEFLHMAPMDDVTDGVIEVVGPGFEELEPQSSMDMGIVVKVSGRKMQDDFVPVLERQIHYFVNGGSGIQHIGQRDIAWIRISNEAADKGFSLEDFGKILHARMHSDFGAIVDKVQVTIYTEPEAFAANLATAREAYDFRNRRLADLTDDAVEEFYSCTLCQSFAPNHVCVVSPERLGLCGAYNWLDCKASFNINPTGPNQPIKLGRILDGDVGYWQGTNDYARVGSHGVVEEVSMYSIMENPMTACGCFECIVMVIPEVKGVMVVSREDTSMTPMGMKFSTLAGIAGGGLQTPGVMGVGKFYIISPKFISADGGFKRVVWMSKNLKDSMAFELNAAAERDGVPGFLDKIADGDSVTTVEELEAWVKEKEHPALDMEPMEAKQHEAETEPPSDDVIAQAEAVVERAIAKEEAPAPKAETPVAERVPAAEEAPPTPVKAAIPPPTGSVEERVERLERAVKTLIGSLVGALAEIGEVDVAEVAAPIKAAPPVPEIEPETEAPSKVELPPDKSWLDEGTKADILKENWSGSVRTVKIGATAEEGGTRTSVVVVGGETAMPFMDFEGVMPNKPVIAI